MTSEETERPKAVTLVTGDYPPAITGVGEYSALLSRHLAMRGLEVHVVTTTESGLPAEHAPGVNVFPVVDRWSLAGIPGLLKAVEQTGASLVHVQYPCAAYGRSPGINLYPLAERLSSSGARIVVTLHDFRRQRSRWRLRALPMMRAAHAVIHPDPADRSHILRWLRGAKCRVECIPIRSSVEVVGADAARVKEWRAQLRLPSVDAVLLYFGTLGPEKGIAELLEATATLRDRGRKVHLLVVGNLKYYPRSARASTELTQSKLNAAAGQGWATLVDSATPELVSRCHHVADIAVLPLRHGAAANRSSLHVAMAHGLPIVTTRGPSTPADFPHGEALHMVPPGDSDTLATGVDLLLTDEATRSELGSAARDAYSGMPTWPEIAERTQALYQQLTAR